MRFVDTITRRRRLRFAEQQDDRVRRTHSLTRNRAAEMGHYILAGDGNLIVERRATPRYEIELPACVTLTDGQTELEGTIINLSEAGARIVLPTGIEDGDVIEIRCPTFDVSAQVIWKQTEGEVLRAGVKFVRVTATHARVIESLLARARQAEPASVVAAAQS